MLITGARCHLGYLPEKNPSKDHIHAASLNISEHPFAERQDLTRLNGVKEFPDVR